MELIRNLQDLQRKQKDCALSIGNFDGIHLGHQSLIKQLKVLANQHKLITTAVIFEPQPQEYFAVDVVPDRLTMLREKIIELRRLDLDRLVCLKFNQAFANLSAREFVQQLIVDSLHGRYLVVGDDFRFGKDRQGDYPSLQQFSKEFDFHLHRAKTFLFSGSRVSSTRIRQTLQKGDLALAEQLLGRKYSISGRVVDGDKRGRTLGFPTANINLNRCNLLPGVYVTRVHIINAPNQYTSSYDSVSSIGRRPMFNGKALRLETHILDFDETIYGRYIMVEFLQRLRTEKVFPQLSDMVKAMQADVDAVRRYFGTC